MKKLVERTCTELGRDGAESPETEPRSLSAYRSVQAYVLLGDPGSGKTTSFQAECEELGDQAKFIPARDFLVYEAAPDELRGRTLFIDGLDEVRTGALDVRPPFDRIRGLLIQMGRPRFRISCREADWLGENDRQRLELVAKGSTVTALRLDPLTPTDIENILRESLGVSDPKAFVEQAHERGVDGLLLNPHGLKLLVARRSIKAKTGPGAESRRSNWPAFKWLESAIRNTATRNALVFRLGSLIDSAGRLCALQLMADLIGYSLDEDSSNADYPTLDACVQGDSSGTACGAFLEAVQSRWRSTLQPGPPPDRGVSRRQASSGVDREGLALETRAGADEWR